MPTDLLSALTVIALFAPPDCRLEDAERFPEPAVCEAMECFYRQRLDWLKRSPPLESWHWQEWNDQIAEARWRFDCWDWAGAARQCEGRGPDYWLYSLRRLRQLIGEEAYQSARMPYP